MKAKFAVLLAIGLLLVLFVSSGCLERQSATTETGAEGGNNMNDARIHDLVDRILAGEVFGEDFGELDYDTYNAIIAEMRQRWFDDYIQEQFRYNLSYIFTDDGSPAPNNINLNTIKRFVFARGVDSGGSFTVVIDRMFNMVYHANSGRFYRQLDRAPFSAEFIDNDLTRLIEAIENSDFRNWQEYYQGTMVEGIHGHAVFWRIGIEFSDGSIMRRSGSSHMGDHYPPQHQWDIFMRFINNLAQEIIERHNAENPQADE